MENIFDVLGITIGLTGVLYAILTNRQKAKMENMVRIHLSGIAGDIKEIRKSTDWCWRNFDSIQNNAVNLEESELKKKILKSAQHGMGDSAAAHRMLGSLLSYVMNTQEGMFGTTEIRYSVENKEKDVIKS